MECNVKPVLILYLLAPCLFSYVLGLVSAIAVKVFRTGENTNSINLHRNTDGRTILRFKD